MEKKYYRNVYKKQLNGGFGKVALTEFIRQNFPNINRREYS